MGIKKPKAKSNKIRLADNTKNVISFEKPVFSFYHMRNGDYHIDACDKEQKASLALKLSKIGQLTWQELKATPKHGLGYEFIDKDSIRGDSVDHLTDDVKLIAFRFWKKAPVVGYRDSHGIFHILWLDKDFSLYDHGS